MARKFILAFTLMIVLVLTVLPYTTVEAAQIANFKVDSASCKIGDTVTVKIDMLNAVDFAAGEFIVSYDSTKLKLVSGTNEEDLGEVLLTNYMVSVNNLEKEGKIEIAYIANSLDDSHLIDAGNVLTLIFKCINTEGINTSVCFDATTFKNRLGQNIQFAVENGIITFLKPIKSVTLNMDYIELLKDENTELKLNYEPLDTTDNTNIVWRTSNSRVAIVNNGLVSALADGEAVITAELGKYSKTCIVKVTDLDKIVENYELDKSSETITVGEEETISPLYIPESLSDSLNIIWSSSNEEVAVVSDKGTVKAISAGKATITLDINGNIRTCDIYVKSGNERVFIISDDYYLKRNDVISFKILKYPKKLNFKEVFWDSSNPDIASVDINTGIVTTGNKSGKVRISVTAVTEEGDVLVDSNEFCVEGWNTYKVGEEKHFSSSVFYNSAVIVEIVNKEIAEINGAGGDSIQYNASVVMKKPGDTKLLFKTIDNDIINEFDIQVRNDKFDFYSNDDVIMLEENSNYDVNLSVLPDYIEPFYTQFIYVCDDFDVATVDKNGIIHGNKAGETTINIYSKYSTKSLSIPVKVIKNINLLEVEAIDSQMFNFDYSCPSLTIKDGDYELKLGEDYEVKYRNNYKVGTAYIDIEGIGKYFGKVTKSFEITKSIVDIFVKIDDVVYGSKVNIVVNSPVDPINEIITFYDSNMNMLLSEPTELGHYYVRIEQIYGNNYSNNNVLLDYNIIDYVNGDMDGNGTLDANDASIILELYKSGNVSNSQIIVGDLDGNSVLDANDASLILELFKTAK